MGFQFADQYSLLHFSVGVIAYFWNINLLLATIIHAAFEYLENTKTGIHLINKYIIDPGYFSWPGEKHIADTAINMLGDNIFFILGWVLSYLLDVIGTKHKWFIAGAK
jgi:hypothetical protein